MVTSRAEPDEWQAVQIIWNVDPDVPVAVTRKGQTQYLPPRADLFVIRFSCSTSSADSNGAARAAAGSRMQALTHPRACCFMSQLVMMSMVHRRAVHRHGLGYLVNMGVNMHGWAVVSAC